MIDGSFVLELWGLSIGYALFLYSRMRFYKYLGLIMVLGNVVGVLSWGIHW